MGNSGIKGTIATFPLGERLPSTALSYDEISKQIGQEVDGPKGTKFRLVRLNIAAGLSAANAVKRCFKYSAGAASTYDVELSGGAGAEGDKCCGVSRDDQVALSDNDLFWIQFDGRMTLFKGDGTDVADGDPVSVDDDADKGKVHKEGTAIVSETFWVARNATTGTDQDLVADPIRPLR